ncbi:hypothetical protein K1T73_07650 [Roseovarius sp. SCSIO 43702]|nr:hypothetical protein K1T73_07650 [Roseovarius sp. SCSIO 43702]
MGSGPSSRRPAWRYRIRRCLAWIRMRVPFGLRFLMGVLLIIGGILSFLPVLGLWMLPLGVAVAALDVKPVMRRLRRYRNKR